ncbi:MAG TPA: NYN domain-containing protein, partial [Myxococcota bacterium]|nr:NYN domain-containing protein [Myxococcota bacterium]
DSDFSPLVSKLKENHKRVIGCGVKNSTSGLLVNSCDEFLYYDDLAKAADVKAEKQSKKKPADKKKAEKPREDGRADEGYEQVGEETDAIDLMLEIVESLSKDYEAVWGSMIKQAMRRVHPDFNEASAGYRNFTELLQEAEREGCIKLEYDERRGNYRVELLDEA